MKKFRKLFVCLMACIALFSLSVLPAFAEEAAESSAGGNVANAVEQTWNSAKTQIQTVVNNVVFPVVDMILAVLFFVKLGTAYFDYRKHGQFEFAAPCILFACLVFTLAAPLYIWTII